MKYYFLWDKKKIDEDFDFKEFEGGGCIKKAFTLVEILIVVVIIGILSAAILPKISNHMAKVRDLKRKQDLQNIAAALMQYKAAHGEFPKKNQSVTEEMRKKYPDRNGERPLWRDYVGSISQFSDNLSSYLSSIPKDPDSKSILDFHRSCWEKTYPNYKKDPLCRKMDIGWESLKFLPLEEIVKEGEYFLLQITTASWERGHAMLFAKVETPEAANRVNWWLGFEYADGKTYREDPSALNKEQWQIERKNLYARCETVKKGTWTRYMRDAPNCEYGYKPKHQRFFYVLLVE